MTLSEPLNSGVSLSGDAPLLCFAAVLLRLLQDHLLRMLFELLLIDLPAPRPAPQGLTADSTTTTTSSCLGPDIGLGLTTGSNLNTPTGWTVRGVCTFSTPFGGMYGEVGVGNGPTYFAGTGAAWPVKFGCSGWLVYEVSW